MGERRRREVGDIRQVGPTSQRGKKVGPGCQRGRAREALHAGGPGGDLGLGVEQACAAWPERELGRPDAERETGRVGSKAQRAKCRVERGKNKEFLFYFVLRTKFKCKLNAN